MPISKQLYYRIPFKKLKGKLSIIESKLTDKCPEIPSDNILYKIENIDYLNVEFKNFELDLTMKNGNNKDHWKFPFYNLSAPHKHQSFKPEIENKKLNSLTLLREVKRESHFDFLGSKFDRFSNNTSLICLNIDQKCNIVGENRCEQCRFGWFEVVNKNCPIRGNRYCGINHCGEKNEPACLRGLNKYDENEEGICEGDLKPVYNADFILICQ